MFHPSPRARFASRARNRALRLAGLTTLTVAVALPAGLAGAHAGHDHAVDPATGSAGAAVGHAGHHAASTLAVAAGSAPHLTSASRDASAHAAHGSGDDTSGSARVANSSDDTPMFVVGTRERPLIARGFRGPLSATAAAVEAHGSAGERFVAARLAAARDASNVDVEPVAARLALSKKQATKKLSRACRRLVAITAPAAVKRLSKKSRKARTKCLDQRRKLMKGSKKKPGDQTPVPGAPTPATPGPAPTNPPSTGGPTPENPSPGSPGAPTPTPRPNNPGVPTPTPRPTPAPTPDPYPACTAPATSVSVTATGETVPFSLTSGCSSRGEVTFTLVNSDESDDSHDLAIQAALANGTPDDSQRPVGIVNGEIAAGTSQSRTLTLQPGKYVLICRVEGHSMMTVKFQVV